MRKHFLLAAVSFVAGGLLFLGGVYGLQTDYWWSDAVGFLGLLGALGGLASGICHLIDSMFEVD